MWLVFWVRFFLKLLCKQDDIAMKYFRTPSETSGILYEWFLKEYWEENYRARRLDEDGPQLEISPRPEDCRYFCQVAKDCAEQREYTIGACCGWWRGLSGSSKLLVVSALTTTDPVQLVRCLNSGGPQPFVTSGLFLLLEINKSEDHLSK